MQAKSIYKIGFTLISQLLFILSNLLVSIKIENIWFAEGFGEYSVIKRLISFVVFPIIVGCGVGIPRFISLEVNKKQKKSINYLLAGISIFLVGYVIFCVFVFAFPSILTIGLLRQTYEYEKMIVAGTLLNILNLGLFTLVFAYFRGKMDFLISSIFHIVVMSLLPYLLLMFSDNIAEYYFLLGAYSFIFTLFVLLLTTFREGWANIELVDIKSKQKSLFLFGYTRVVGEIALFGLGTIPIYFISIFVGLKHVSIISLSLMFFKLITAGFESLGTFILPYLGRLYVEKTFEEFRKEVLILLVSVFIFSSFISLILYLIIPQIVTTYFNSLHEAIPYTQYVVLSTPFYLLYVILRNAFDIVFEKAYNSIILSIALVIQCSVLAIGFFLENSFLYDSLSLISSNVSAGILSVIIWQVKNREK